MKRKIIIIAGESSGDFHGASLIKALREANPTIEISAVGGARMASAGAQIYYDIKELSIIGFTDVLKNIRKINDLFNSLLLKIDKARPDVVVLIDYPGFNLKLAGALKKRNIPVIYYISPQIWAWWKNRIKTIKDVVDKMIVVFKFEEKLYLDYGVDVSFVGHPLLDAPHVSLSRQDSIKKANLNTRGPIIGLAPGSRKIEIERILPVLLATAKIIKQKIPTAQFTLLKSESIEENLYAAKIKQSKSEGIVFGNQMDEFLNTCDFVLVASGTATLETAIMEKPMIIVYKVSLINWLIAKMVIKLPFIGLVNVVAGEKIVPEFIQYQAKPDLIAKKALELMGDKAALLNTKAKLQKVRQALGTPGASKRTAGIILELINKNS